MEQQNKYIFLYNKIIEDKKLYLKCREQNMTTLEMENEGLKFSNSYSDISPTTDVRGVTEHSSGALEK